MVKTSLAVCVVVPRKGDVDRNLQLPHPFGVHVQVVPRKGDVDRNAKVSETVYAGSCRPPQGGRG